MVDYLRDTKGVTNVLYNMCFDCAVPDPVSPFSGWFPGANYVDIIGFDGYDNTGPCKSEQCWRIFCQRL
jgi:beta-mannanase